MPRNRQIFKGRSIRDWSGGELSFKKPNVRLQKLHAARINQGMITTIDSADIPLEALQLAKNVKVVFDKTSRRDALSLFTPAKPNANSVIKMSFLKEPAGTGHTYRFTPTTIHDLQAGVWNALTITVPLLGDVNDKLNVATVFDVFAFTNNGANNVQWINGATSTSNNLIDNLSASLTNSKFRFCTGFYNRIVLAALKGENEILLAWTGEYGSKGTAKHGLEDLDPLVNETSGFSPLVDSPSDTADFITGVFGLSSVLVILREKSIWLATKQASATNPFNAYAAVPGIGCDSPYSAQVTNYGIAWLDRRSRTVYHYTPGNTPEIIGKFIEKTLIDNIVDPLYVYSAYDPIEDTYSVCIPAVGTNLVRVWTYYFKAQAWTYNEYLNLSSFDNTELLTAGISIDNLTGTIDELSGIIDDLSPVQAGKSQRIFGFTDGELAFPDETVDVDYNQNFQTDLISKSFFVPSEDINVASIVIEYIMHIAGTLEIWYAPDGGVDAGSSFIFGDSFTPDPLTFGKPQIITFKRLVHTRRYAFALRASNGKFDVLGYEVWVSASGDVSMTRQVG